MNWEASSPALSTVAVWNGCSIVPANCKLDNIIGLPLLYSEQMSDEEFPLRDPNDSECSTLPNEADNPEQVDEADETLAPVVIEDIGTGCPFKMGPTGSRCGRELHMCADGIDNVPVCLMHSKDPAKVSGQLFESFWWEFEQILDQAGERVAHFEQFVFPKINLMAREIRAT